MLYATSIVLTQITPLLHLMNTRANGASHALVSIYDSPVAPWPLDVATIAKKIYRVRW